jgi:hypothetical protein
MLYSFVGGTSVLVKPAATSSVNLKVMEAAGHPTMLVSVSLNGITSTCPYAAIFIQNVCSKDGGVLCLLVNLISF